MLVRIPNPDPRIVRAAPLLCIEILSSDDRMSEIQERITEYAEMGCATSWAVDPWKRLAYRAGPDGLLRLEAESLSVPGTPISIQVDAIFAELDRLERRAAIPLL